MSNGDPQYELSKAFFDSVGDKVASGPARTFNSIWRLSTGWIDMLDEKLYLIQQQSVERFKKDLKGKISEIPKGNQQDPKLSLIGPALESTKYYVEEEELRNLFVNLITKSMDDRYNDKVNHAFVEIIKQLSPIDAYILKKINTQTMPVARYELPLTEGRLRISEYYLIDDIFDEKQISISLINLKRLGLIDMPEGMNLTDSKRYDGFSNNKYYKYYESNNPIAQMKHEVDLNKHLFNDDEDITMKRLKYLDDNISEIKSYKGIKIVQSIVELNGFGKAFYDTCVK